MDSEFEREMDNILAHYEGDRDELITILQEVQDKFRYLPEEALCKVADFLEITVNEVYSVATFYALFRFKPSGRKIVCVCRGTACHVRGGSHILHEVQNRLGIKPGGTTRDMEYSLETVACIGACALAPNISIDKVAYGQVNSRIIEEVIGDWRKPEE